MGVWTDYGKQQLFAVGCGAIDQPALYVILYEASADPAGPPVELTLSGYGRQGVELGISSADHAANTADIVFGPMGAGAYQGLAIADDPLATDQVWFWDDQLAPVTIPAASTVTFAAGTLLAVRTP